MSSIVLALGTTAVAYVYPLYATYKALVSTSNMVLPAGQEDQQTEKPTELSELETWTMYCEHEGDLEDILEVGRTKALSVVSTTIHVLANIVRSEFLERHEASAPAKDADAIDSQGAEKPMSDPTAAAGNVSDMVPPPLQDMARAAGATAMHWVSQAGQEAPPASPRRKLPRFRRKGA
ncbi:hypothetical protein MEQU1_000014 [Malassezia equina]|uniref:Uncharacterized protein n=1 Tax=Malassezia equina TaxID=1381935 RepID=A0AAF0IX46_9BASI|nr:hypothetical protein MEQU1_000014 [Malassezia equina]